MRNLEFSVKLCFGNSRRSLGAETLGKPFFQFRSNFAFYCILRFEVFSVHQIDCKDRHQRPNDTKPGHFSPDSVHLAYHKVVFILYIDYPIIYAMDQIAKAEHDGNETNKKGLLVKMVSKHL